MVTVPGGMLLGATAGSALHRKEWQGRGVE
jgi:hypothetical protein